MKNGEFGESASIKKKLKEKKRKVGRTRTIEEKTIEEGTFGLEIRSND